MRESHIAGPSIALEGRWLRQRCVWCGKTLLDYDLERVAIQIPEDGSPPQGPAMWAEGAVIRTEGNMHTIVDDGTAEHLGGIAPDCCLFLDPEVTR